MRRAQLVEIGKISLINVPEPEIKQEAQVKVKVKAVGICGTDLHIFKEGRADVELPRVMGHELSGIVIEIGSDVERIKVGDKVILDPVFACGKCNTCKKGFPNVCEKVACYGVQMNGGYQDIIVVDEKHLYVFAKEISFEEAALAEPFSIATNILDRTKVAKNEQVIVIGAGTIGLSIVQAAIVIGGKVAVLDIADEKLKKALEFGAEKAINSNVENVEEILADIAPVGFDVVIDAVGSTSVFVQSINYAAPRARIACIGFDSSLAGIPPVIITKKELSIIGSRMNCLQFPKVVGWMEAGKLQMSKMISKKFGIDNIQEAFEYTLNHSGEVIKTLITF